MSPKDLTKRKPLGNGATKYSQRADALPVATSNILKTIPG